MKGWRRWLLLPLFILLTVWVYTRFTDFQSLFNTLSKGIWQWLVVAFIAHIVYFLMYAQLYRLAFRIVDVSSPMWHILAVMFGALFINAVAPAAGLGGGALFVDDAARRGESGARTGLGITLVFLLDLATLLPFLGYSLFFLAAQHKLAAYDWITSLFYILFVILLSVAIALSRWRPARLEGILKWLRGVANHIGGWFKHPDLIGEDWPGETASELNAAAEAVQKSPKVLIAAIFWAIVMHGVNMAGLYTILIAFHQHVQIGVLTSAFSIGIVYFVVTIIPQGVGAVEGVMALIFTSLGVPKSDTVASVLVYRAYNFWLPLVLGIILLRETGLFGLTTDDSNSESETQEEN